MANNKPKIKINRKSIDQLDTEKDTAVGSIDSDEIPDSFSSNTDNLDSSEIHDPFSSNEEESNNSNPFEDEIIEEIADEVESPFLNNDEPIFSHNPFETDNQEYNEDYEAVETPYEAPSAPTSPNADLIIDPEMPYFFVFGNAGAGKSAMLSGLLYYIQTSRIGQLRSLGLNDQAHHRKGDYTLSQMTKKVRNGQFAVRTKALESTDFVFPTEINLEFEPNGKMSMPFCLLEMAGEDLEDIQLKDEGKAGGNFDARINAYLEHPDCNLKFICVVDADTPETSEASEDLINQFLQYVHKAGHTSNPVLITVNKWDKIEDQYSNVKDYLEEKLPILTNNLFNNNRDMAYMKFSIGDVVFDAKGDPYSYTFHPEDSRKLLDWMYETATAQSLNEEVKTSALSKFIKSVKNTFSNE